MSGCFFPETRCIYNKSTTLNGRPMRMLKLGINQRDTYIFSSRRERKYCTEHFNANPCPRKSLASKHETVRATPWGNPEEIGTEEIEKRSLSRVKSLTPIY